MHSRKRMYLSPAQIKLKDVRFVVAGQTVGGSRIVLNLRRAYYEPKENPSKIVGAITMLIHRDTTRRSGSTLMNDSFSPT